MRGIMQFVKLFNIHKDRQIKKEDLHWGEEIEYHLYSFNDEAKRCQLSCDADDILTEFNSALEELKEEDKPEFNLMPEFGSWMLEAVPSSPYGAYSDPEHLLSCFDKICNRRASLQKLVEKDRSVSLISMASSPILGTENCVSSNNPDLQVQIEHAYAVGLEQENTSTKQKFLPEITASPHPRFLGLA